MKLQECEQRNNAIIKAWREWKKAENYLANEDLKILCAIFNIKYPLTCQKYLITTDSPNQATTTAPSKKELTIIFNFLDKLAKI